LREITPKTWTFFTKLSINYINHLNSYLTKVLTRIFLSFMVGLM
jgi:hypothetical protein